MNNPRRVLTLTSVVSIASLALVSCAGGDAQPSESASATKTAQQEEVAQLTPRIFLTFDGGVMVLDATSGEHLSTLDEPGFLRLSPAGDGRHVMVADGDEFKVLDSGLVTREHGDHNHYYEQDAAWTGASFDAPEAGHVVSNQGKTALFADGTGGVQLMNSSVFVDGAVDQSAITQEKTDNPHHGVAVPLSDGGLLVTQGDEESRDTIQVWDADGSVVAETTDCPGVHGEAVVNDARGDIVSLGCENGPVIYRDGEFHKVEVPEKYQRSGNQFSAEGSPIVLADYKVDEDAELERPTRIGLIDTRTDQISTVDLGSEYWFRSLARGKDGQAVVLTYDGRLNIVDPETGQITDRIDVIPEWEEKEDWQQPGPSVQVAGEYAYVTDPEEKKLHVVNVKRATVVDTFELPEIPNEVAVVTGKA